MVCIYLKENEHRGWISMMMLSTNLREQRHRFQSSFFPQAFLIYEQANKNLIKTITIRRGSMRGQHNKVSKVCLGITVLMLLSMEVSALVYLNSSQFVYLQNKSISTSSSNSESEKTSMRGLVITGANYFLQSYSDFMQFLSKIENSELVGLDYNEVQVDLNRAIERIGMAQEVYAALKSQADITPYNGFVLQQLVQFNFFDFQAKNRLVESIFKEVRSYLEKGDIRGVYGKVLADTEEILGTARSIKEKIDAGVFPEIPSLWNLGQSYSRSFLFGQYVARVFVTLGTN